MSNRYTYAYTQFANNDADAGSLSLEIYESDITVALVGVTTTSTQCYIDFKAALSNAEWATLSGVVAAHEGQELPTIVPPHMDDGRPIVRSDTRPLNTSTYFTCQGDTASGIGNGPILMWDFTPDSEFTTVSGPYTLDCGHTVPDGYKAQVIDMQFLDPVYFKDGALYFFDAPWLSHCSMEIIVPSGSYYPNETGSIPASALGLSGDGMYSYASTNVPFYRYVNNHFMYGSVPMGDELNAEGAMVDALPVGWIVRGVIQTPVSDTKMKGFASFEMYRKRSVIKEGDTP